LNKARGSDGKRHEQCCPAHAPPGKRAGFLWVAVVMMVVTVVMPVIVASVVIVIV
jgi:hypothetical protein